MAKRNEPYRCPLSNSSLPFDDVIISLWPDVSRPNGIDPILTHHGSGTHSWSQVGGRRHMGARLFIPMVPSLSC
jgi:hypothetical protein